MENPFFVVFLSFRRRRNNIIFFELLYVIPPASERQTGCYSFLFGYSLIWLFVNAVIWKICVNPFNPLNLWQKIISPFCLCEARSNLISFRRYNQQIAAFRCSSLAMTETRRECVAVEIMDNRIKNSR
ncbi:hypothetical protein MCEGE10_00994 [Flavobacteriaceae bacterium]